MVNFENPLIAFNAYVSSLSVSLGWGGQGGSMQIKLVEDPDDGYIIDLPPVGTAVYFKYEGFYFGGILQRWVYNESLSGRIYDVVIESPSKLMDGVQLIIENFNGATDRWAYTLSCGTDEFATNATSDTLVYGEPVCNVYNVFAYYENPSNGINGPFSNYGASGFNSAGLQVSKILDAIAVLGKRDTKNPFGGALRFGADEDTASEYELDLSELSELTAAENFSEYRLKGPVKNLNTIIGEMADLFQFDYYYTVQPENMPSENGAASIPLPIIKLKILDRSTPPEAGKVAEFVAEQKESGKLISSQVGQEFGDTITQKIVWGGNRSRYLQLQNTGAGTPHYAVMGRTLGGGGYNTVGTIYETYDQDPISRSFTIFLPGMPGRNGNGSALSIYKTTAFELRMALGGKETWEIFKTFETLAKVERNGFNNIYDCPWTGAFDNTNNVIELLAGGGAAAAYDLVQSNLEVAAKGDDEERNHLLNQLYNHINDVAQTSYGQEFLLVLPNEVPNAAYNYYIPQNDYSWLKTWDVASSAYTSSPPIADIANFDSGGRLTSLAGWPLVDQNYIAKSLSFAGRPSIANPDFSVLGSDYAIGGFYPGTSCDFSGTMFSKKGSPEQETYWFEAAGTWAVIFRTGAQVRLYDPITTPAFGLTYLAKIFFDVDIPPARYISMGKTSLQFAIPPDVQVPRYFGIPQESTRFRWGPWVTNPGGGFSTSGKAQVEEKESLRPETFGAFGFGITELNRIGQIEASVGLSEMQQVESGYVEVEGAPMYNIGERFVGTGPYVSNMDISVDVSGGVKTNYKLTTWTPEFGTMNKYNINRIADIRKRAFEYAKKQRDQIEQRPFPAIQQKKMNLNDLLSKRHNLDNAAIVKLFSGLGDPGRDCPPETCDRDV